MLKTSQTYSPRRQITRADIMPLDEYGKIRKQHRATLVEQKRKRRVHIGPHVTLYFESYETMWAQVQEMLYIERGGEEQIEGELSAYNPLIPQGAELVATMMIEIEDEDVRRRTLSTLGHIEDMVAIKFSGHTVKGVPEDDLERTTAEGKTSSVHFLHFPFTPEQLTAFREPGTEITVGINHPNYGHMAVLQKDAQAALAEDFA
tara:strand:- start:99 stop:710 length:612 start_codon:yes stop_codon:yes gene_type:complete